MPYAYFNQLRYIDRESDALLLAKFITPFLEISLFGLNKSLVLDLLISF